MSRVQVSYVHGEHPSTRTESLEGLKVGFEFDDPRDGMFKIWANSEGKEQTFFVRESNVICWDIEIDKAR